jgi:hypothetical protein
MLDGHDRRGDSPDLPDSRRPAGGGAGRGGPGRDRSGPGGGIDGLDSLRTAPLLRWMGAMRTRTAMLVLLASGLIGVVLTLLMGQGPGFVLAFFVIIGAIVATLGVRRGTSYLFFPLPALILFIASIMIGAVHDRALESTGNNGLGVGFLQWVAAAFFPMCVATLITLAIGACRWLLGRQLISGNFPSGPASSRSGPGARRPAASDPWADDAPRSARPPLSGSDRVQGGTSPRPAQNGTSPRPAQNGTGPRSGAPWQNAPRDQRDQRDQRTSRDPWGDPRLPSPPPADPRTRPAPQFQPHDRTAPRPAQGDRTAKRPAQGDRTAKRPAQGDPRDPSARPAQGDPWDQSTRQVRPPRPPRDPRDER